MYCLRCGKETELEKVFCGECLQTMEKYPVKPGTAIHLHHRQVVQSQRKASRAKRHSDTEDQILFLRKALRVMGLLLILSVIGLAICTVLLLTV